MCMLLEFLCVLLPWTFQCHTRTHTSAQRHKFQWIYAKVVETNSGLYGVHTILFRLDYIEITLIITFLSFIVPADANIKDMTFIAQFAGDVDYLENRENDYCDCLMTLLLTADLSQRLVICPDKCGNISRFMSGIDNHTP